MSGLLVGLYALAGFVLAPRLLRAYLVDQTHEKYGRQLSLGPIHVNPFKFTVELEDIALPDADGKALLGAGRLFVDFQGPQSVWERAFVFREITLERPHVRCVVRRDGRINLGDLAGEQEPAKIERDGDTKLIALWIQALSVEHGVVDVIDRTRPTTFESTLEPLDFSLRNFRTTAAGGAYALSAALRDGGQLALSGKLSVAPRISSTGQLAISGFQLPTVKPYASDWVTFGISSGSLDVQGNYAVSLGKRPTADANLAKIALRDLTLASRDRSATVQIPSMTVENTNITLLQRSVAVGLATVQGFSTRAIRAQDGSINLMRMLSEKPTEAAPEADAKPAAAPAAAPWTVNIAQLELQHGQLIFEDHVPAHPAELELTPVDLKLEQLSLDLAKPVAVSASLGLRSGGRVRVQGHVSPQPLAADLDLQAENIALVATEPYVMEYASVLVRDGELTLNGKVGLEPRDTGTQVSFRGDLALSGLRTLDAAQRQDFFSFEGFDVEDVRYISSPPSLDIAQITLRKPYLRVILTAQQQLNVMSVLNGPLATNAQREGPSGAVAPSDTPPLVAAAAAVPKVLPVKVKKVAIAGMRMNFSDDFSRPHFVADMQQLTGTLRDLSSDPRSRATLDLKGRLGGNSTVSIAGKLQPFAYDKSTDIRMVFKNIALPIFNPYSGRYAGYNIARGELATDIHYKLQNRKLEAKHNIRIDQLEWGEETNSKEAASLPVKLATVLLRDRHGVIKLDLPVDGTLDDPEFHVWPLIWQVVGNTLLKAVTFPFDLIGSLFEGSEKARYVDFDPGSSELTPDAQSALAALGQVLNDKPELLVDVPVATLAEVDRPGLIERRLQERVAANLRTRFKAQGAAPAFDSLPPRDKIALLSDVSEELTGKRVTASDVPQTPGAPQGQNASAAKQQLQIESLEHALRDNIKVSDEELTTLGRHRGEAIEAALQHGVQLDATRVLLTTEGKASAEQGRVRFELVLH